ncbi:unnamed protein product [Adineta steineri]|uniref:G-protein coupled receptors family 1 profile domain-containing protein n=1 Tax=Adineta steineri TaxID=433720 RepID=A0A818NT34_9BILA|nr:unnamed protein product [Adineta steineri]CAF3609683.1 unnamed protein product [Adineta steineri]
MNTEYYYWNDYVPIQTTWACQFYNVSFFSTSTLNRFLMAFMAIERHFLVFRHQLYRTRRSRYLLHYFPILIIIIYSFTYSIYTDIFLTCPQLRFRYTRFLCGYTCSLLSKNASTMFLWFQLFTPTVVTCIACFLLPIRFLFQKRNLQRLQWRRARKMIVQMIIIAGAYILSWLPYAIILQLATINLISLTSDTTVEYMVFDSYVTSLLTPFICLHTISERLKLDIIKRIIRLCFVQRQNTVHVQTALATTNQCRTAKPPNILPQKRTSCGS